MTDDRHSAPGDDRPDSDSFAPRLDLEADLERVSRDLDGDLDSDAARAIAADPVLHALRDELEQVRRLVGEEPEAPGAAVREVHLTAAMAAFDELHTAQTPPTILDTVGPEYEAAPTTPRPPVADEVAAARARRRSLLPLGAVAAAVLVVAFIAGSSVLQSDTDDTASEDMSVASDAADGSSLRATEASDDDMGDEAAPEAAAVDSGGSGAASLAPSEPARFDRQGDLVEYARGEVERLRAAEGSQTTSDDDTSDDSGDVAADRRACDDSIQTYTTASIVLLRRVVYLDRDGDLVVYDQGESLRVVLFDTNCDPVVDRTL